MESLVVFRTTNVERIKGTRMVNSILNETPAKGRYIRYLLNVYNYAQHSPTVISLAASRCIQTHRELGRYLFQHAQEEIGHEDWAWSDLKACGLSDQQIRIARPTNSCMAMIGLEYYVAGTWNPLALFGWLYALESLGDALGSLVSKTVGKGLQFEGKAVYFLEGHGEADHHHSKDLEEHIHKYITSDRDLGDIMHIAGVSSDLYAAMLDESFESPYGD